MKRFWIFSGQYYYPSGGLGDLTVTVDTPEEVDEFLRTNRSDWVEVFDQDNLSSTYYSISEFADKAQHKWQTEVGRELWRKALTPEDKASYYQQYRAIIDDLEVEVKYDKGEPRNIEC